MKACLVTRLSALGAAILMGQPAAARDAVLHGTYANDCAPYDGAAFVIRLPGTAPGEELRLAANAPLSQAIRTWPHSDRAAPMHAEIALCRSAPTPGCSFPRQGSFRVDRIAAGTMTGSFEATFADGRKIHGTFVARDRSQRMLCG